MVAGFTILKLRGRFPIWHPTTQMSLLTRTSANGVALSMAIALAAACSAGSASASTRAAPARPAAVGSEAGGQPSGAQQTASAQALAARRQHERARRIAQAAGAEAYAPDLVQQADAHASNALAAFDRGDFEAARRDFELAEQTIQDAVARTAAAAEAARAEAEAASRAVMHGVADAEAEVGRARNLERRGRFSDARLAYERATSLYEEEAGTERALVDADVFAVLQRYESAMEDEDLEAFKELWLEIDEVQEHRVSQSFEWFDSIQIDYFETAVVEMSADTATITSIQRTRWVAAANGDTVALDNRVTFTLRKRGTDWFIENLRMEAVQR